MPGEWSGRTQSGAITVSRVRPGDRCCHRLLTGEWDSGAGSDDSEEVEEREQGEQRDGQKEGRIRRRGEIKRTRVGEDGDRRLIQPDICAISQLLNFDEVVYCVVMIV